MLNWHRDPSYEQRKIQHEQRMKQLESETEQLPGSPGELPPEAPTDPDVTLSRHQAPVIQLQHQHHASEQKDPASAERSSPELADCGGHDATTGCVSDAAMRSGAH